MKFLDSSNAKLRSRLEETRAQRERSLKAIYSGRPLDAEDDLARKIGRIKAVANVNDEEAAKLANYDESALSSLPAESRNGAESIQGKSIDFVSVCFLELAQAAASSVGRVIFRDSAPQGSGFMISDHLFITNNHVIKTPKEACDYLIEFDYELDVGGQPKNVTRFELAPTVFFATSPEDDLDYTIVAVGNRVMGKRDLPEFGYCPITNANDKHTLGEHANIIQHPDGDFKQIVLRENQLAARNDDVLQYFSDTKVGSSGSPVFNDQWEAIGLHHWGKPTEFANPIDGGPVRKDVNEGIRISAIVKDLESKKNKLSLEKRKLLDEVLNCGFGEPSLVYKREVPTEIAEKRRVEKFDTQYRPDSRSEMTIDKTATWTIPLEISVRLSKSVKPDTYKDTELLGDQEAIRVDPNYENRNGYASSFLQDYVVPLPKLTRTQEAQAARKLQIATNEDPYELRYQHFSIVMNAERRMAFFTAVNIDGYTWINIDRKTGEMSDAEAAEKWYEDPRIAPDFQCNQSLYDRQIPERVFDRGHLVRRQDPSWGTPTRAKKANTDTFHFTNCAPQERDFNQRAKYWQGIEEYVLDNAKAERERVTVFTGPVFSDGDLDYRYVKVPRQFWKILVRVENGKLLATALLADQSALIKEMPEGLGKEILTQYQTSVKEIERLTGLDFGALRDCDTFSLGPAESISSKRKIESFDDISLDSTTGP